MLDWAVGGSVAGHGDRRRRELLGGWKEMKKTAGLPLRLVEELETTPKEMTKTDGGSELGLWRWGNNSARSLVGEMRLCCGGVCRWRPVLAVVG